MKVTAIILTHNEEENIENAVKSVSFCDEIIVVDDNSTDNTLAYLKKTKAKVFQRQMSGDFSTQRNWAMEQAKSKWILFLDADETISKELKEEIESLSESPSFFAYNIKRRDFWWGRELHYGEILKVRNTGLTRLVRKGEGVWIGNVHERFISTGKIGTLRSFIDHFPHPTLKGFIEDINHYSTLRAKELFDQGVSFSVSALIFLPFFKFILNYFIYCGFLDGPPGFVYAFLMSFHSFLVRAKLYQYSKMSTT